MTITQLEYIIAVDTYRNFALAASKVFVTQPTLSMQIKKLEEELGVVIFDRSKKPVIPTPIGEQVLIQARQIVKEFNKVQDIIDDQLTVVSGELRVGIIPTLSPYLLPDFIPAFLRKYPDVHLSVEELMTDQILYQLNNDLLDVGILVTPIKGGNFTEVPLFYEDFLIYLEKEHALLERESIDIKDLNLNEMWLLKEGHCFRNQMINLCGEKAMEEVDRKFKFESGSLETLKRLVDKQGGYTLLPQLAVKDLSKREQERVRRFSPPQPVREVSLIIHRSFLKRKLIELLREEIMRCLPKDLIDKQGKSIVNWV
jgi:LysR family hydrogen peroxide-inducible transcriptional activator